MRLFAWIRSLLGWGSDKKPAAWSLQNYSPEELEAEVLALRDLRRRAHETLGGAQAETFCLANPTDRTEDND